MAPIIHIAKLPIKAWFLAEVRWRGGAAKATYRSILRAETYVKVNNARQWL